MIAEYLPALFMAWSIQLVGVASPGPSVALILGVATAQGRTPALAMCLGIGCASIVMSIATVVGLAALFSQFANVMLVVKFIGSAYLLWLSYGAFRRALNPPDLAVASVPRRSHFSQALNGFVIQLSNPKAIFFWIAIAGIGGLAAAPLPVVALFVAGAFVNSTLGHGAWALLLSAGPFRRLYARARARVEGALGCFFAFAAFQLATVRN